MAWLRRISRVAGSVLLVVAYILVMCFGFLSGMLSEGLIGAESLAAVVMAEVIVWFGVIVGLSPLIPLASMLFAAKTERTAPWWVIRLLPFILLAIQLVLGRLADCL